MAKVTGLGWTTASVDDSGGNVRAIKNDFTELDFETPREVQEATGIDKSAVERLLLLADFSIKAKGVFNPASNQSHDVFKTVPSTSVARTVTLTTNGVTLANETMFSDYKLKRDKKGELIFEVPGMLADGTVPTWT